MAIFQLLQKRSARVVRRRLTWGIGFVWATATISCSGRQPASEADSVRGFVQDFYNWYVPAAQDPHSDRPSELAMTKRAADFAPTLAGALKEDAEAQAKSPSDIVGLDFDPFLASQDPCDRYDVVDVRNSADGFQVSVRGTGGCENHELPDVVADVVTSNGNWLFTNFEYPALRDDLLTILKKLRDETQHK